MTKIKIDDLEIETEPSPLDNNQIIKGPPNIFENFALWALSMADETALIRILSPLSVEKRDQIMGILKPDI